MATAWLDTFPAAFPKYAQKREMLEGWLAEDIADILCRLRGSRLESFDALSESVQAQYREVARAALNEAIVRTR